MDEKIDFSFGFFEIIILLGVYAMLRWGKDGGYPLQECRTLNISLGGMNKSYRSGAGY